MAKYMLNVIPLFIFNHSFLLCFLLNACWWGQIVISQGWTESSVHLFPKKPIKLCLLFFHVLLHKSRWWRSLCCLCLFDMIAWKKAKPSQLRFWMESRYSLMFSASKSHPIPSLVLPGQVICPPSLWEWFTTGFFPGFVQKLQRALLFPLDIWIYQVFSIPKAPSFSVHQTCISRRSLYFSTCAVVRDSHSSDSLKRNSSAFLHPGLFPSSGSSPNPSSGAKPNFERAAALAGSVPTSSAVCQLSHWDTHLQGESCTKQSLHCHARPNSRAWSSQTLQFLGRRCHSNYLAIMSAEIIIKHCM